MTINRLTLIGGSAILFPLLIFLVPWYPWQVSAGLILLDRTGRPGAVFNTPRMARGWATEAEGPRVAVEPTETPT